MAGGVRGATIGSIGLGPVAFVLALPLIGLGLLLAQPEWDMEWEHQPSHFWLVLVVAAVSVVLAYVTNAAAGRFRDARLVLISLAFLSSAGFLGLHALATPGVLLPAANIGFAIATPVGLIIAAGFAAAAVSRLAGPGGRAVLRARPWMLAALLLLMAAWAVASTAGLPPLDGPPPSREGTGVLDAFAIVAIALYAYAAWRLADLYRRRGGSVVLSMAVAVVLFAEALIAIIVSRNWHFSWWEWHLLLLAGFMTIALAARHEYRRRGSLTSAFGGLYLEATLARVDRWYAGAVASVAETESRGADTAAVFEQLRREGATDDEITLLASTAAEVRRLDDAFRPYLPDVLTERIRTGGDSAPLPAAEEREVSVLFADLAGFTAFSERHTPREVVAMLNAYWAAIVPVIEAAGGTIEHFAGDGIMVMFGVGGSPEASMGHARRAATTGRAIIAAAAPLARTNPEWPTFRVGVNTGLALVGTVGADARRSFATIGDAVNTAARLMAAGDPGDVIVGRATWESLADPRAGDPLGPIRVKGKRDAVEAWRLRPAEPRP